MALLLGLAVACAYGSADFLGGLGAKRSPTAVVVVISQVAGLGLLAAVMLAFPSGEATATNLGLGAAVGVAGLAGLLLLYHGLSTGVMSVVAPITAVGAAVLPVLWGVLQGERPSAWSAVGAVVALASVVLVSRAPRPTPEPHGGTSEPSTRGRHWLASAIGAGVGFGIVFIILGSTGDDAGFWPLLAARVTSLLLAGVVMAARGIPLRPAAGDSLLLVGAGVLDITANALFVVATRRGLLSLVSVVASLYPAATVLLARLVLSERLSRTQLAGVGAAGLGVVLIAAG
ncbi:MAG: hypothetical protein AVDCRST_MAG50-670 [uncultured Acidimicrobiales bacterium]|uniref:EamA domain-containing protein n=1 Tax=uncultured Acidimicrobiales bacterium TaxID=310071 RepID=A0A6J4HET3_9ACTN|nr:MAG: hypothetical protein AVDCRST_MAG50-670 [uncultured Acidimicrobiales bacterium]